MSILCSYCAIPTIPPSRSAINWERSIPPLWIILLATKSLYSIYQKVQKRGKISPVILVAEELYENPDNAIQEFCKQVGIPYLPQPCNGPLFKRKSCTILPIKIKLNHWCQEAIQSTGITKPTQYEVDSLGQPTFSEIKDPSNREQCKKAYEYNLEYYNLLR